MKMTSINKDIGISIPIILISIWMFLESNSFPLASRRYPQGLAVIISAFATIMLLASVIKKINQNNNPDKREAVEEIDMPVLIKVITTTVICIVYVYLVGVIGFFTASTIFAGGLMIYLGVRKYILVVAAVICMNLFIYLLFNSLLRVPIPQGLFF